MDLNVGGKYKLLSKIGNGSFGEIYQAEETETGKQYAVKLEPTKCKLPQLLYEAKLYKILTGGTGIPNVHWYGIADNFKNESQVESKNPSYNWMVIDLLGQSLEDLFDFWKRKFTVKTVCMIADQLLHRIEYFHSRSFLHRDLKPENFLIGIDKKSNIIHIIDYGLGKMYRNIKTGKHIAMTDGKSLTGTARYASINVHLGLEQGRRDDLLSIGYILIYFLKGTLPWIGIQAQSKQEKYDEIKNKKLETSPEQLWVGEPEAFLKYFKYCSKLDFDQKPNYSYLRGLFKDLMKQNKDKYDYDFDWVIRAQAIKAVQRRKENQENIKTTYDTIPDMSKKYEYNRVAKEYFASNNKSVNILKSENGAKSKYANSSKYSNHSLNKKASIGMHRPQSNLSYKTKQLRQKREALLTKSNNLVRAKYTKPAKDDSVKLKQNLSFAGRVPPSKQSKNVMSMTSLINNVKHKNKEIWNNLSVKA